MKQRLRVAFRLLYCAFDVIVRGNLPKIVADVAQKLVLSHEHVRQVANSWHTSRKVENALLRETRRRERLYAKGLAA